MPLPHSLPPTYAFSNIMHPLLLMCATSIVAIQLLTFHILASSLPPFRGTFIVHIAEIGPHTLEFVFLVKPNRWAGHLHREIRAVTTYVFAVLEFAPRCAKNPNCFDIGVHMILHKRLSVCVPRHIMASPYKRQPIRVLYSTSYLSNVY